MKIGYTRVSPSFKDFEYQLNELTKFGCEIFFHEKASSKKINSSSFEKLIDHLRKGDVVVVCSLCRIDGSVKDVLRIISSFQEKKVDFVSLQDKIDTRTEIGFVYFEICRIFSEHEGAIEKERSLIGSEAARSRGRLGGRPKGLSKEAKTKADSAKILKKNGGMTVEEIAKNLGVSRATCYRYIAK